MSTRRRADNAYGLHLPLGENALDLSAQQTNRLTGIFERHLGVAVGHAVVQHGSNITMCRKPLGHARSLVLHREVLVPATRANDYANPAAESTIVNTVTVTGDGLSAPITATATITAEAAPELTISKSITPTQVVDNDRVTYTFVIQNSGNEAVVATDNAAITDTFDPILTALTVTFNGTAWTEGVQYTYDEATGLFTTNPGQITVPAATYTQDPVTGAYTVTPGIATLIVTGTI